MAFETFFRQDQCVMPVLLLITKYCRLINSRDFCFENQLERVYIVLNDDTYTNSFILFYHDNPHQEKIGRKNDGTRFIKRNCGIKRVSKNALFSIRLRCKHNMREVSPENALKLFDI